MMNSDMVNGEEVSCDEWYITNHVRNNAVDNIVGALPLDCHRI